MPNRFSKVGAQQVALLGGNAKMASDPKRNQTVLHLSTLGAIGGEQNNTFVDDSPNRYTITRTGNVSPSTFSPYGDSWSNYFDGTGDYLSIANNAGWNFGSGNFTIECWIYTLGTGAPERVFAAWNSPANAAAPFCLTVGGGTGVQFGISSTGSDYISINGSVARSTWAHVAVVRNGSTLSMYINGILSESITTSVSILSPNAPLIIGGRNNNGTYIEFFNGNISNLRIVKGTALYTADFTPSKTPLTAVSGTSLLTCASNRFGDKSSNNFAITPNGNAAVKTASPFPQAREFKKPQRGWCVPFNGSTQRLETPAASVANGLQLGTSDFTIECWVKAKPQSNYARAMDSCVYGNPNYAFTIGTSAAEASTDLAFSTYTGATVNYLQVNFPNVLNNSWNHIAVVRSSNVLRSYVNGELISTLAMPVVNQNLNFTTPIVLGAARSPSAATYSNYFSGKISNVMIVKKALYSGNFVPMGSPRTADQIGTSPVLLACQASSIVDMSYTYHTLTSAGSLVVDSDGPFDQDDELSYYFDGNGDYLRIADNAAIELGSGNFTIECWFNSAVAAKASVNSDGSYHVSIARKPGAYDFVVLGTASGMTGLHLTGFITDTTTIWVTSSFSFTQNTWYHLSVCRQGTTIKLFVNGNMVGQNTSYVGTIQNNTQPLYIGGGGGGVEYSVSGNISNFRLVTGAALYTASFTPSRKPLPIAASGSTALLTCRGRTAADQSNNNLTVTVFGTAETTANPVSRKSPFREDERYGMSYYFDGSGDYLNVNSPSITQLAFGTGDFTIECWIYPLNVGYDQSICDFRATTASAGPVLRMLAGGAIRMLTSGLIIVTSATGVLSNNCWHHIVATKTSNTVRIFVNGVLVVSGSNTTNFSTSTTRPTIGAGTDGGWLFYGYISQFSAYRYVARYTANFTPPSSPQLIGDYSQSLLLNAYPAIYDTTRKNAIETLGSFTAARGGPPWGTRAERYGNYFNGSSNYLVVPNSSDFDLGTGDFTIETWVNIDGNSATDSGGGKTAAIISCYASSTQGWMLNIGGNATTTGIGLWLETHNAGTYVSTVTPTISISQNIWHHIAVTRSSGVVRFFLNGTQQGSNLAFTTSLSSGGGQVLIGGTSYSGYPRYLNGYIHDLRITKGTARYTSNFTLPKLPHPIK